MSIRARFILGITTLLIVGFYFSVDYIVDDIELRYRESTEEPLVDLARVLTELAARTAEQGRIDTQLFRDAFTQLQAQKFSARIFDLEKTHVDLHVYITDPFGIVIFDSDQGRDEGRDYSQWRDVHRTLKGLYGARSSPFYKDPSVKILYIAAPILVNAELIGVLSVGKPTYSANQFTRSAQKKLIEAGIFACLALIAAGFLFSHWVTRPIRQLTEYARAVRDGKRVERPRFGSSELSEFGNALEEMRNALEGKRYIENYVKTLTHEIKSPLSAIRGAAELLEEDIPAGQRRIFLRNIREESQRLQRIVENLLLLSSLEHRKESSHSVIVSLSELLREIAIDLGLMLSSKAITLIDADRSDCNIRGDAFLLRQALLNLLQNAIEFSPTGGAIEIFRKHSGVWVEIGIRDHGEGIPDYAKDKIFERFYSLKRPDSGKKSSGLGLSLVKEIIEIHGGTVRVENHPGGGVLATVLLPAA